MPYRVVRGRSFYDRAEVKDVAAYLRLCVNPRSDVDLLRIVNMPPRGIGDTTIERLRDSAGRTGLSLWEAIESMERDPELAASARSKLGPFRDLLRRLGDAVRNAPGAADAIELVMSETGCEDRLRLEGEEGEDRLENLYELVGAAREFDGMWAEARGAAGESAAATPTPGVASQSASSPSLAPGALGSPTAEDEPGDRPDLSAALAAASPELDEGTPDTPLLGFLEQLALVGDADAAEGGDRVSLMTLHAAKGLEFDAVWLTGLEERVFPHARSLGQGLGGPGEEDPDEMAEERRLCYVGMTRARKKLTLTSCASTPPRGSSARSRRSSPPASGRWRPPSPGPSWAEGGNAVGVASARAMPRTTTNSTSARAGTTTRARSASVRPRRRCRRGTVHGSPAPIRSRARHPDRPLLGWRGWVPVRACAIRASASERSRTPTGRDPTSSSRSGSRPGWA